MWLLSAASIVCLSFALQEIWVRHPASHFFPLPLVAWIWLARRDGVFRAVSSPQNTSAFKWLTASHLLLALAAFVLVSPFLAGVAFVLASTALAAAKGRTSLNEAPAWSLPVLSLFFIPTPLMLDQHLHQVLAGQAARLSQVWLDAMNVLHAVQGTIVATAQKRFFVDDACSGTNTLLVAVCMAVILSCFNRRSFLHVGTLMLSAALISVTSNVLRICVVIGGLHYWGMELDQGAAHEAVGLVFFIVDLLMVWSADHGIHFILNSAPGRFVQSREQPRQIPAASMGPLGGFSVAVAVVGTGLLLGPEILALTRPAQTAPTPAISENDEFQMPHTLAGWVREGDKPVENAMIGKLGVRNQVWLYRKDGREAYVAVNFPFLGFHDTRLCYTGQGWQFQRQVDGALPGDKQNTVRFLEMNQPTEMARANLWLSVLDQNGIPQTFHSEKPANRIADRLISRWTAPKPVSNTYVLQVMSLDAEADDHGQDALTELLSDARKILAQTLVNQSTLAGKESE